MSIVKALYIAPAGDDRVVDMGGKTFFDGQPVDLDSEADAGLIAKLRTNQHFAVDDGEAPPKAEKPDKRAM